MVILEHFHFTLALLCVFAIFNIVSTLPVKADKNDFVESVDNKENLGGAGGGGGASTLLPFLKRFGYLESSNSSAHDSQESDSLYTEGSVMNAIKDMQKFGGLPQTGVLNDETLSLLTKPRCGLPDIMRDEDETTHAELSRRKRYIIGSKGWNKRRLTYRVENWAGELSESDILSELRQAFNVWAEYARLRFKNKPRESHDDVDISISFGRGDHADGYPFDGPGGVLAHAFFPYTHGALAGDIHFDVDENWKSGNGSNNQSQGNSESALSFLAVAVHEIGHSLGLSHSPSQESVMFPYYQVFGENQGSKIQLGYDDIMAMYQLYIQRHIEDFPDEDEVPVTQSSRPQSTTDYNEFPPASSTSSYDATTRTTEVSSTTAKFDMSPDPTFRPTVSRPDMDLIPNLCKDGFDTISFIRNEVFVFKNKYMWRFQERGVQLPDYPAITSRLFPFLKDVETIDAAFEDEDNNFLFFSGNQYWIYKQSENQAPSALPITDFGLPEELQKIDAAFVWGKNRKIYFFSDAMFWKYNSSTRKMEEGYPKGLHRWGGLPKSGIDSAILWSDEQTYFFKGDKFWRFDDSKVQTEDGYPLTTSAVWFGC